MSHDEPCNCNEETCQCEGNHECNCGCECCGDEGHFQRRYQTKEEQIAVLETYLSEIKLELQAVEEHLADLRK